MDSTYWLIAAVGLNSLGMVWCALALPEHWQQVMRQAAPQQHAPYKHPIVLGLSLLVLALLCCLSADRPSMALLVWVMLQASSAVAVAMVLTYRPQSLAFVWPFVQRR